MGKILGEKEPSTELTGAGADVRHVYQGPRVLDQCRMVQGDTSAEALGVHSLIEFGVSNRDGCLVVSCGKDILL